MKKRTLGTFASIIMGLLVAFSAAYSVRAAEDLNEVTMEKQTLGLDSVENARQLGGYITTDGRKVREDKLLRTGKLSDLSTEDISRLEKYDIGTIIDLRSGSEIASAPDDEISGAKVVKIDMFKEIAKTSPVIGMKMKTDNPAESWLILATSSVYNDDMYVDNLKDEAYDAGIKDFFKAVLDNKDDKAILWHCSSGKDRTGITAALLLSALGVDRQTIIEDYTLTNEFQKDDIAEIGRYAMEFTSDPEILNKTMLCKGANPPLMIHALKYMDEEYGSPIGFLEEKVGIEPEEIIQLQAMYLE